MQETAESPIVVALLFVARCVVPLLFMLGISYLLRRLGLIAEPPPPPENNSGGPRNKDGNQNGGGVAHGKV